MASQDAQPVRGSSGARRLDSGPGLSQPLVPMKSGPRGKALVSLAFLRGVDGLPDPEVRA